MCSYKANSTLQKSTPIILKRHEKLQEEYLSLANELVLNQIKKHTINAAAKKIGIYNKNFAIDSNFELLILLDYIIFHHIGNGHKIIDRYINNTKNNKPLDFDESNIIDLLINRSYGILKIIEVQSSGGILIADVINKENFLLVDEVLSKSALPNMFFATEYLHCGDFIMTTVAALPLTKGISQISTLIRYSSELFEH